MKTGRHIDFAAREWAPEGSDLANIKQAADNRVSGRIPQLRGRSMLRVYYETRLAVYRIVRGW